MRVKNYLGECSLKITCPNGECSEILVSNPVQSLFLLNDCTGIKNGGAQ